MIKDILGGLLKIDWFLVILIAVLVTISLINMTGVNARSELMIYRQLFVAGVGFLAMFVVASVDYRYLKSFSGPALIIYVMTALFLIAVLFFAEVRGISAWIKIFSSYSIQPSEFGKLAVLIILAKYFSGRHKEIYQWKHIVVSGIYAGIPAGLTFLQPDFGSMFVYMALWFVILIASGIKRSHILILIISAIVMFALAWFFVFKPYQKSRIISFVNPHADSRGAGYNSLQSQTTFGSGGSIGSILQRNTIDNSPKLRTPVPEPYTDFAFAVFGQKFGFIGVVFYLSVLFAICYRIGSITSRAHNNFIKLFGIGFVSIIAVHATINIGMNIGLFPITGIPLSFLSYGGSHMAMIMIGIGIIQSYYSHG